MAVRELDPPDQAALEQVLGYLNLSSGAADPSFLANLNRLYVAHRQPDSTEYPCVAVLEFLATVLAARQQSNQHVDQALAIVNLLRHHVLPGYLEFHRDLLFHQTAGTLFSPFFFGRVCEVLLREYDPGDDPRLVVHKVIEQLNDYVGHRPVATLENQKVEPYEHEAVRPVPLYVRGAGVADGPAAHVISIALKLLQETDPDLLREAHFDPQQLEELALDPRAYDFDHPVNKRPNYHFGQWDPHQIDGKGRYRRYVVQEVALSAMMRRLEDVAEISRDELEFEAAAVLAGTILMAAGVSGSGPDSHDSSVTLSTLLPRIARYRDEFYDRLLARMTGDHAERLRQEARERKQPFGGARQHLNAELARRRASQLEHVQLARIFARMGFAEAATRQVNVIPTASARMLCQIDCWLTELDLAIRRGAPEAAKELVPRITDLLHRGIECGAIIDPRNILGFDAHFSLFPAMENSVHDHRADELVRLVEQICNGYARIWSEFAARDRQEVCRVVSREFEKFAWWWHQFAAHEVKSVDAIDAFDAYRAATRVAEALNLWHRGGAAAGDVAFWAPHAEMFDSSRAYALVIEALLEKNDFVASLALMVHWLSQADHIPLHAGENSFHDLAERWLLQLLNSDTANASASANTTAKTDPAALARRMLDYFEANAESFWEVPRFELAEPKSKRRPRSDDSNSKNRQADREDAGDDDDQDRLDEFADDSLSRNRPRRSDDSDADDDPRDGDQDDDQIFGAAYEEMVYRDTTDDGVDGAIFETGRSSQDEFTMEAERIVDRTAFLGCLARLWKTVVTSRAWSDPGPNPEKTLQDRQDTVARWRKQAETNRDRLVELLDAIHRYRIPEPKGDMDSMIEFDQRRATKESLLDQIVSNTVETTDSERILAAAESGPIPNKKANSPDADQLEITRQLSFILRNDMDAIRANWSRLTKSLASKPLLYVPLSKGGEPRVIVATRVRQRGIQDLLTFLPRLGLIRETCELLDVARRMETDHPIGAGAVTEFDELFKRGYKAIVESLVISSNGWGKGSGRPREESASSALVGCLEKLTESLLLCWLNHSRTLRLSVMEKVHDKDVWGHMVEFIQRFGGGLFTQRFLNQGNIRSILHQGADNWLEKLRENREEEFGSELIAALDRGITYSYLANHVTLVLEAVIENYGEYRDYNSTTTQSDRGELIYTLLDFLRLRTRYDRVAWNLKPVVWAHEVLVRAGRDSAARMWRRALTERIQDESDQYLAKLAELQKKYAMKMPTVADRLGERFVRPMAIDRIRALVEPAISEAGQDGPKPIFELLEQEAESLAKHPTGVGLDVPTWLMALEDEVEQVRNPLHRHAEREELRARIPQRPLTLDEAQEQLDQLLRRKISERK